MYTPPNFWKKNSLFIVEYDPRTVGEEVDPEDGKLQKKGLDGRNGSVGQD
jgi:hypothetical protein